MPGPAGDIGLGSSYSCHNMVCAVILRQNTVYVLPESALTQHEGQQQEKRLQGAHGQCKVQAT